MEVIAAVVPTSKKLLRVVVTAVRDTVAVVAGVTKVACDYFTIKEVHVKVWCSWTSTNLPVLGLLMGGK
jgi:hypothetical protein